MIPRYEDNCGELIVTIEEIVEKDINICDVKPVVVNGQTVGIRVDAGIFQRDTVAVDGRRNILISQDQIGIIDNGRFICPDSLVCDSGRTNPLSIGLVIDVSGSMQEPVDYDGRQVTRLDAVKLTLHNFMRTLKEGDSLFLLTFSTEVVLSHDWTADTARIGKAIDALQPLEYTSLHAALIRGLQKTASNPRPGRVLIALTDGLNNQPPLEEQPVIDAIRASNVPLYLIALGFAQSQEEQYGMEVMRRFVGAAPRGRLYEVHTGNELNNVYTEMATSLQTEDCCRLYFPLRPCDLGQRKRTIRLVYLDGDSLLRKEIVVDCDLKTTSVSSSTEREALEDMPVAVPTPSHDVTLVQVPVVSAGPSTAMVYDQRGLLVARYDLGYVDIGQHVIQFETVHWPTGLYLCHAWNGVSFTTTKILVKH